MLKVCGCWKLYAAIALLCLLPACMHPPTQTVAAWRAYWPPQEMMRWRHQTFPGKNPVQYSLVQHQGRAAVQAKADAAMSVLRQEIQPTQLPPGKLHFAWLVSDWFPEADMSRRETEDSPVRIVLAFDGDKKRFTAKEAALNELTRTLTGHEQPYATLMYVWCSQCEAESLIINPRTARIRKIVVQAGPQGLGSWQTHQRDVLADFQKAFGEPAGPLIGIGIMTDSDNTQTHKQAWYGDLRYVEGHSSP